MHVQLFSDKVTGAVGLFVHVQVIFKLKLERFDLQTNLLFVKDEFLLMFLLMPLYLWQ